MLLGIDLGGTKTEAVVLHPDGTEAIRKRVPTIAGDYNATIATICDLVAELEANVSYSFEHIGIGIPGSISPHTGLVRNANSTWINGKPFQADIARALSTSALSKQVRIENDANCLALSEACDGAGLGAASVFAVILGTGVGGGLVFGGQIVTGANGLAGEWGHVSLAHEDLDAPNCFCGQKGCNETYLSGPAILRDYALSGGEDFSRVQEIVALASTGDDLARQALARHLDRLARALGAIINIIDPDVIVLGGGVSNLPGLLHGLPKAIAPYVFCTGDEPVKINIKPARWGDSSGVRGAARLWEKKSD